MREADSAFLVQLRPLFDPHEVQREAAAPLGRYLDASRVGYADDVGDGERVAVSCDYTNAVPSLVGVYRYSDYGPELLQKLRAGQTFVRNDIARDSSLSEAERAAHRELQLGATINVPLVKAGQLVAIFFVHFQTARTLASPELELLEEVAQRVWSHVERAKAERTLRESEQLYHTLFDAIDDGFQLARVELAADGSACDVRLLELNSAWSRMTGIPTEQARGKLLWRDLLPELDRTWLAHFERAVESQQTISFESFAVPLQRWLDCHVVPFGAARGGQFIAVLRDSETRKRAEQALQRSEEKYAPCSTASTKVSASSTCCSTRMIGPTTTALSSSTPHSSGIPASHRQAAGRCASSRRRTSSTGSTSTVVSRAPVSRCASKIVQRLSTASSMCTRSGSARPNGRWSRRFSTT